MSGEEIAWQGKWITVKTKGKISIRITSRGGAQVKTGTFKRTVR